MIREILQRCLEMLQNYISGDTLRPSLASELAVAISYTASRELVSVSVSMLKMFAHQFLYFFVKETLSPTCS